MVETVSHGGALTYEWPNEPLLGCFYALTPEQEFEMQMLLISYSGKKSASNGNFLCYQILLFTHGHYIIYLFINARWVHLNQVADQNSNVLPTHY